jgi:RNA polymerase sigma factor (sigma-70 family)
MINEDMWLVREYATRQSETAFATLISRHTNLVYSAALRLTGDLQLAEEITQVVFIILARKAASLGAKTILTGWLYRTTCYVSRSALKRERRRQQHEQEAYLQSDLSNQTEPEWTQLSQLLDEAMMHLGQIDRDALVLRYFEGRSLQEVGSALGRSEDAAKKRVRRALEKLRSFFVKRGVSSTTAIIADMISANSVQAAPVALAKTISTVAVAKGAAVSPSTLALIQGALKVMAWTKIKIATVGALVLTGLVITPLAIHHEAKRHSRTLSPGEERWSKDSLSDEGYGTPEAALETFLWAMTRADYDACMAGATPEQHVRMEADLKNVSREDFAARMRSQFAPVTGFQIVGKRTISHDAVIIDFRAEGANQWVKQYTFKRIGNEWKFDR